MESVRKSLYESPFVATKSLFLLLQHSTSSIPQFNKITVNLHSQSTQQLQQHMTQPQPWNKILLLHKIKMLFEGHLRRIYVCTEINIFYTYTNIFNELTLIKLNSRNELNTNRMSVDLWMGIAPCYVVLCCCQPSTAVNSPLPWTWYNLNLNPIHFLGMLQG